MELVMKKPSGHSGIMKKPCSHRLKKPAQRIHAETQHIQENYRKACEDERTIRIMKKPSSISWIMQKPRADCKSKIMQKTSPYTAGQGRHRFLCNRTID
jgi:hypothetical protein